MLPSFSTYQPVPSTRRNRLHIPNMAVWLFNEVEPPRPGRAARAIIAAMTVVALTLLGVAGMPARQAQAQPPPPRSIEEAKVATYNSQGSKWDQVRSLMRNQNGSVRNDIVAVQESGGLPLGAGTPQAVRTDNGFTAFEYHWTSENDRDLRQGTRFDYWIYYLPVPGAGNNRNSMAIVTQRRADEFAVMDSNPGGSNHGSVGVRFGNQWYWNIHAYAGPSDNLSTEERTYYAILDVDAFTQRVRNRSQQDRTHWALIGDQNIDLQMFSYRPIYGEIIRPLEPTHQNGAEYDWAIIDRIIPGYGGQRANGLGSDHIFPVEFRSNLVASGEQDPNRFYQLVDHRDNLAVDSLHGQQGEPVVLNSVYPHNDTHQLFDIYNVAQEPGVVGIKSDFSGLCFGLAETPNAIGDPSLRTVKRVVLVRCDPNDPRQHFRALANEPDVWYDYHGERITSTGRSALAELIAAPRTEVPLRPE